MPHSKGERHPRAKLTAQDVADIRAEHRPRLVTAKHLAQRHGVSEGTVRDILSGRTWSSQGRPKRPSAPSPLESDTSATPGQGPHPPRNSGEGGAEGPHATRNMGTAKKAPDECIAEGCNRASRKRGRCERHYRQWLRKKGHLRCAVEGCMAHQDDKAGKATGSYVLRPPGRRGSQTGESVWLCRKHERLQLAPSDEIEQLNLRRLRGHIRADAGSGCWMWTGPRNPDGYGYFQPEGANGLDWYAHRALYDLLVGGHGPGLQLDHRCDQRECVAPFHLRAVIPSANSRRRGKTVADPVEWQTARLPAVQQFAHEYGLPLPVLWS